MFTGRSFLQQLLLRYSNGDFLLPTFLWHLIIYITMGSFMTLTFLFYALYSKYYCYSICAPNSSSSGRWELSQVGSCALLTWPHTFWALTTSVLAAIGCSRLTLYFPCPSSRINPFSKDLCFILLLCFFLSVNYM